MPIRSPSWPTSNRMSSGTSPAGSRPLERRVSLDRRALHERIDTLQAELVARHKSRTGLRRRPAVVSRDRSPSSEGPGRTDRAQFVKELPERFNELGSFIREQRSSARLSLRRLSELAGISNPYLSQIERGLRRPSAEILQQIAKALRISAETLYVQAGILEAPDGDARPDPGTSSPTSRPHRGAEAGARADLPLVPPRERRRGQRRAGSSPPSEAASAEPAGDRRAEHDRAAVTCLVSGGPASASRAESAASR